MDNILDGLEQIPSFYPENLSELSPAELVDFFCEVMLKYIEEQIRTPIHINFTRTKEKKPHQDFKTSFLFSYVIVRLKFIGDFLLKINNVTHIGELDYGLRELLIWLKSAYENNILTKDQFAGAKKLINEYILDENLNTIKSLFLVGHNGIHQHEMLFLLYEFTFKSPIFTSIYCFEGKDVRKTTFSRIETATINIIQDHKLNIGNIENQLLNTIIDFNYNIKEIIEIIFVQKEIYYRTSLLNSLYFNFEHFLSEIIETFRLKNNNIRKKIHYLSIVLNELQISQHIDYSLIYKEIEKRCKESSTDFLELLKCDDKKTISFIQIFDYIISIRNSFHSNGASNKDIKAFSIGKIDFLEVKQGKQILNAGMHNIIILILITTYAMEQIIQKMSSLKNINGIDVPMVIKDKYLEGRDEFIKRIKSP